MSIPRGALAESIYRGIEGKVETIFGDSVRQLEQTPENVRVIFEQGDARHFDLVVGADGLHSGIRELAFGPEQQFEEYLGYKAAAFESEGYRPRDELVYVMYTQVGQQVARFSMRNDRTLFLFTFADPEAAFPADLQAQKRLLRERFGASGWECPGILNALDAADDLYFDRVSQIRMNARNGLWTNGRVTLLGDAAACPSLLAGEGSGLAMVAAYILAGELHRSNGRYAEAFARYQERFSPFVLSKQNAAERFAGVFAPKSSFSLFIRNQVMNLMGIPWIARLSVGRTFLDHIALPDY